MKKERRRQNPQIKDYTIQFSKSQDTNLYENLDDKVTHKLKQYQFTPLHNFLNLSSFET